MNRDWRNLSGDPRHGPQRPDPLRLRHHPRADQRLFYRRLYVIDGTGVRLSDTAGLHAMVHERLLSAELVDDLPAPEASRYLRQHWKRRHRRLSTMGSYGLALWAMTRAPLAVVAALRNLDFIRRHHRVGAA